MTRDIVTHVLILVDQDGVLADFERGFLELWLTTWPGRPAVALADRRSFKLREEYPAEFRADVDAIQQAPGFFAGLPVVDGALEAMRWMLDAAHDVRICTAPLTAFRNCVEEKHVWVETHLGADWVGRMILTKDKTLVRGDILIDDNPSVTGVMKPTWTHVVFSRPYNCGADGPRVTWRDYQQVLSEFEPGPGFPRQ